LVWFSEVQLESSEAKSVELQYGILKERLEAVGMETGICVPGQYNHLLCPKVSPTFLQSLMLFEQ